MTEPSRDRKRKEKASRVLANKDQNVLIDNCHNYAIPLDNPTLSMADEVEFPSLPSTPNKPPTAQKKTTDLDIVATLSVLINSRSDAIEEMVRSNTLVIEGLKKTVEFACAEIKEVKGRVHVIEKRMEKVEQKTNDYHKRVTDMEQYTRRWNLRLYGVPEVLNEDVRCEAIRICQAVMPENKAKVADSIDIVHRLGRKKLQNDPKPRGVIILFTSRFYRDAILKAAKKNAFLQSHGLRFAQHLCPEDIERRSRLWPLIKKAREEGKAAYFVGGRGFINGSEIKMYLKSHPAHLHNGSLLSMYEQVTHT